MSSFREAVKDLIFTDDQKKILKNHEDKNKKKNKHDYNKLQNNYNSLRNLFSDQNMELKKLQIKYSEQLQQIQSLTKENIKLQKKNKQYRKSNRKAKIAMQELRSKSSLLRKKMIESMEEHKKIINACDERCVLLQHKIKNWNNKCNILEKDKKKFKNMYQSIKNNRFGNCSICCTKKATHAFIPCGHLCICSDCFNELLDRDLEEECIYCRSDESEIVQIFLQTIDSEDQ